MPRDTRPPPQPAPAGPRPEDRVPPHDEGAERGLLGCILGDSARLLDLCVERRLEEDSFWVESNRVIYRAMLDLYGKHQPVDILTVGSRLRDTGAIDIAGGEDALLSMVAGVTTMANAEHYISRVYETHLMRRLIRTAADIVDECHDPDMDGGVVLANAEAAIFDLGQDRTTAERPWAGILKNEMADIEKIISEKKSITGISTGYEDLDKVLFGLHKGDMIVLAARPSMGKTSLALNIAENVVLGARNQPRVPVGVFSLEMSAESLARRMLCGVAGVSAEKLSGGMIGKQDHDRLVSAADKLSGAPLFVDDTPGLEVVELRARARRMKRKYDIGLIVIDYLQQLHDSRHSRDGLQRETASISQSVKEMAKELKVPVLILSQLSRAPETRDTKSGKPKLSDLRDSGAIEQDADVVMMLRRPCKYPNDPEHDKSALAIVEVAKHRNGPTAERIPLFFDAGLTRFSNWTELAEPDDVHFDGE